MGASNDGVGRGAEVGVGAAAGAATVVALRARLADHEDGGAAADLAGIVLDPEPDGRETDAEEREVVDLWSAGSLYGDAMGACRSLCDTERERLGAEGAKDA